MGAFWDKVSTFMGLSNEINVKKAFMRGPQTWVTEYNHVVGEGNTVGNGICFKDIVGCKAEYEDLAKSVVTQYAIEMGMSSRANFCG